MVFALVGCPATPPREESRPPVSVVADPPPAAAATSELPDFGEPKPPVPAASKAAKEAHAGR
jgi:hypothetical protein